MLSRLVACGWAIAATAALALPGHADEPDLSQFERSFTQEEREHWAFQPVRRPEPPTVGDAAWVRTPIDAFILSRLESENLHPASPADRRTLLRRAYLDLIGLPPTPEEQRAFLENDSPDAFAKVVDDLLARPQYGERWARHWLDAVRYAESNGYERDGTKPHAWRYRDYVIRSLNEDKPYDRFLVEQLAGDEVDGSDAETQIATTFLRLGTWDDEPAEPKADRYEQLDDVLATTSRALLGLTLQCARCHEHKFEPLTQVDYARMLAVFEPLKRPQDGRKDLDRLVGTAEELAFYEQKTKEADVQVAALEKKIDELRRQIRLRVLADEDTALPPDAIAAYRTEPEKRSDEQKELVKKFAEKLESAIQSGTAAEEKQQLDRWQAQVKETNAARPPDPARAYIWYEEGPEAPATHVFVRGDPTQPAAEVTPGPPAILADGKSDEPQPTSRSTGRRIWLARWITRSDNPLTARVLVNRIWQHHFGEGIVRTENDFGLTGDAPTHPDLLDWLAAYFTTDAGWRLKPLHRMILLSSTYRMSSAWNDESVSIDPDEHLLWRWKPRRLEAEAVRDSILAVNGRLNTKMFGPSIYPRIARAVLEGQSRPGDGWGKSDPSDATRRSVYIFIKRSLLVPELELLDFPDTTSSCEQRVVSTIAPQALTYMNGAFLNEQAAAFADRLRADAGDDATEQVRRAFELALCRPPTDEEESAAVEFLVRQQRQIAADRQAATSTSVAGNDGSPDAKTNGAGNRTNDARSETAGEGAEIRHRALKAFCLVLLNTNEFVYVD